jgi:cytochrome c biogenesis protein CcdA
MFEKPHNSIIVSEITQIFLLELKEINSMSRRVAVVTSLLLLAILAAGAFPAVEADASGAAPADRPSLSDSGLQTSGAAGTNATAGTNTTTGISDENATTGTGDGNTTTAAPGTDEEICVVLFYAPGCPHCQQVESSLAEARGAYDLRVKQYRAAERPQLYQRYADRYGVPVDRRGYVPTMFVGDRYCIGSDQCLDLLDETLSANADSGLACPAVAGPTEGGTGGEATAAAESDCDAPGSDCGGTGGSVTLAGLMGLALVDAVNPCALAVLLLLLTVILAEHPDRKETALASGVAFSLAILLVYFLIGVLFVLGFRSAASVAGLSASGLYPILGGVAVLLGLLNLKDWLWHGAGGFVLEVPFSWRPRMRRHIARVASPLGAFAAGLLVSLFLLPCTSGPYVVAGGMLASVPWNAALGYLLAYNLVFVLPMLVITLVVYGGFASVERIAGWRERNVERLHLVAGVVLLAIGGYLLLLA